MVPRFAGAKLQLNILSAKHLCHFLLRALKSSIFSLVHRVATDRSATHGIAIRYSIARVACFSHSLSPSASHGASVSYT